VLCLAFELHVSEDLGSSFIDLGKDSPESLYPHEYVAAAAKAGIVMGKTPLDFGPWDNVSRAQMITMVVRAAQRLSPGLLQLPPSDFRATLGAFSGTHAANVRIAEYNGLLEGLEGFGRAWDPWAAASRGEVVQVLWRWQVIGAR
jgi:hypothetical protein